MISRAGGLRAGPQKTSALSWWMPFALSLLWRLPVLLVLAVFTAWFGFRALVHMAFLFDRHPLGTFLLAPVLMPFAAVPPLCFVALIAYIPRQWRAGALSPARLGLLALIGPVLALLAAVMVDLIHINLLRMWSVPLPRLPFDPY